MNKLIILIYAFFASQNIVLADSVVEKRCGWFENPSPGNASLIDKDGEWLIAMQGEYQSMGNWPQFKPKDWVKLGLGNYGYGCACLKVSLDKEAGEIIEILNSYPKSLSTCRLDKSLPRKP